MSSSSSNSKGKKKGFKLKKNSSDDEDLILADKNRKLKEEFRQGDDFFHFALNLPKSEIPTFTSKPTEKKYEYISLDDSEIQIVEEVRPPQAKLIKDNIAKKQTEGLDIIDLRGDAKQIEVEHFIEKEVKAVAEPLPLLIEKEIKVQAEIKPKRKRENNILSSFIAQHQEIISDINSLYISLSKNEVACILIDALKNNHIYHEIFNKLHAADATKSSLTYLVNNNSDLSNLKDDCLKEQEEKNGNSTDWLSFVHEELTEIRKVELKQLEDDSKALIYSYVPILCNNSINHPNEACPYSHSKDEINFHPLNYKTMLCSDINRYYKNEMTHNLSNNQILNKGCTQQEISIYLINYKNSNAISNIACSYAHDPDSDFRKVFNYKDPNVISIMQSLSCSEGLNFYSYTNYYGIDNLKFNPNTHKVTICANNLCRNKAEAESLEKELGSSSNKVNPLEYICDGYHHIQYSRRPQKLFGYTYDKCGCGNQFCNKSHRKMEVNLHPDLFRISKGCTREKSNMTKACSFLSKCYGSHSSRHENNRLSLFCSYCTMSLYGEGGVIFKNCSHLFCFECFNDIKKREAFLFGEISNEKLDKKELKCLTCLKYSARKSIVPFRYK